MINNMYSIYDNISQIFNRPFVEINDNSARRAFQNSLTENQTPTDYELYYVGQFNDDIGEYTHVEKKRIMTGFDIKPEEIPAFAQKQAV